MADKLVKGSQRGTNGASSSFQKFKSNTIGFEKFTLYLFLPDPRRFELSEGTSKWKAVITDSGI